MDAREIKERATQFFSKGKFAKAAEAFEDYCKADPRDIQARLRMGDAWSKAGKKDKAIIAYTRAAEGFAKDGFLPRAIAASKLILELDPAHQGVQKMLADLYAQKSGSNRGPRPLQTPAATAQSAPAIEIEVEPENPLIESSAPPVSPAEAGLMPPPPPIEVPDWELPPPAPIEIEVESSANAPADEVEVDMAIAEAEMPFIEVEITAPLAEDSAKRPPSSPPGMRPQSIDQSWGPSSRTSSSASELEKSLEAFSHIETGDVSAAPKTELASFTELELEGDSLLQAVEAAAGKPYASSASVSVSTEDAMEALDEPKLEPGALPKIPLFSDLPADAFIALFEQCPLRRAEPGDLIVEQGSQGDSFFVICAGSATVFRAEKGQRREVAALAEGTFFGEMALLSDAPRSASVEAASEDTQMLEIPGAVLTELSRKHPAIATALKKFCRQRLLSNLINGATLFKPFTKSERRELVQRFRAREVKAGEVLIREGERSDGLYVILTGEVFVEVKGAQVASLKEGDVFGEMSLLTRTVATATVKTVKKTSVLRLPREDFDALIMSHPQILEQVAELSDSRTRKNAELAKSKATAHSAV